MANKAMLLEALADFAEKNVGFADAYHAAFMRHHGIATVYSCDRDFDRLGVERKEG
ncbi:MAG: PIN domain-containing protein [Candidatus Eremiobacteraeota bacterium]|nr:PIN domain-containing protein [Candidatus Eremiobacteraeota bacterium]